MKKICAMLISASVLNSSMAVAEQDAAATAGKEAAAFGPGVIPPGLAGAPDGDTGATFYGGHAAIKDDAIASLEKQLTEKSREFTSLQGGFEADSDRFAGTQQRNAMEKKRPSLQTPGDGITFPVYFRTNDAGLSPELGRRIRDLAILVRAYPRIKVRLDAYADERGLPSYNLQLSRARILSVNKELSRGGLPSGRILQYAHGEAQYGDGCGDPDMHVPDRRVDIRLTLDDVDRNMEVTGN